MMERVITTQNEEIDYSEIDSGIVTLIKNMNQIAGVITTGSCEGHLIGFYKVRGYKILGDCADYVMFITADKGQAFLIPGFINFSLDESHKQVYEFKDELTRYAEDKPHINFRLWVPKGNIYQFISNIGDLRIGREELCWDNSILCIKNEYQFDYFIAFGRWLEWKLALCDFTKIVEKYYKP